MAKYLLDTTALIDYLKGHQPVVELLRELAEQGHDLGICCINVTELYSKGFNLTIPPNTHEAGNKPGTWRAGSQGWWVFLKPLSPGQHTPLQVP